jgi:hypothetical protein
MTHEAGNRKVWEVKRNDPVLLCAFPMLQTSTCLPRNSQSPANSPCSHTATKVKGHSEHHFTLNPLGPQTSPATQKGCLIPKSSTFFGLTIALCIFLKMRLNTLYPLKHRCETLYH